jgi:sodium-dependent dicarboxylate transporter 2/3/5
MVRTISHATITTNCGSIEELVPSDSNESRRTSTEAEKERKRKIRAGIMISTCLFLHYNNNYFFFYRTLTVCFSFSAYSSVIGGTGSLIGSSPQLALKGIVQE